GDLAGDPHLLSRGFFRKLNHPVLGETMTDTHPIRFEGQAQGPWKPAPLLGEDNRYVFGQLLGLSDEQINAHIEKGVIA
ncbi:MAG: CoA transferase, partial [Deltaproteobacteria bacterium]|nr:CoA transferase [Deltaproteobacteria bacterium]